MAGPGVAAVCGHGRDVGFRLAKVRKPARRFMIPIRRLRQGRSADSDDGDPPLPRCQAARTLPS
jgi:hypothetical protein